MYNSSNSFITVLMPVYNGAEYIIQAIESILNQSFTRFELLIVDDCSEDNSVDIIKSYNDQRINLISNVHNIGQTRTLNKGIKLAQGKYIARMDQDDISKNNRLDLQSSFLIKNPDIVLLGSNCKYIDSKSEVTGYWQTCTSHVDIINSFCRQNPFAHSSVIFEKDKIIGLGCYPDNYSYAQDLALWSNICLKYKVANLNEYLVKIRYHTNQATANPKFAEIKIKEELSLIINILQIPSLKIITILRLYIKYFRIKIFTYIRLFRYSY